jgi:hypothetical protein
MCIVFVTGSKLVLVVLGANVSDVITSVGFTVPKEKTVAEAPAGSHRTASNAAQHARHEPCLFHLPNLRIALIPIQTLASRISER